MEIGAAAGTVLAVALVLLALRRAPSRAAAAALLVAPVALVLLDDDFRVYSHHGLLHASYVAAIATRGAPPEDPFFAGAPLSYPWLHHAMVAGAARATGLGVPELFAATSLAALALCAGLLYATAGRLGAGAPARLLAPLLALAGVSPFTRGPGADAAGLLGLASEARLIPLQKFASVNSNQLGLAAFAWALYGLVRWCSAGGARDRRALAHFGGAVLVTALLYPLLLPLLAGTALVAAGGLAWRSRRIDTSCLAPPIAAALALLPALPYLLGLARGKEGPPSLALAFAPAHLVHHAGILVLFVLAPLALRPWRERAAWARPEWLPVAGAFASGAALYLVTAAGYGSEYKFLAAATLPAGLALAEPVAALAARRPALAAWVLALAWLPMGTSFARAITSPWGDAQAVRVAGPRIVPARGDAASLASWVTRETPPDAVFVDVALELPAATGRSLYVAEDPLGGRAQGAAGLAGFGMRPSQFLPAVAGRDPAAVERRQLATLALVGPGGLGWRPEALSTVQRELGARPLFLVARSPAADARLRAASGLEPAFGAGAIHVYRVRPQGESR
jgi:hypothetical protein